MRVEERELALVGRHARHDRADEAVFGDPVQLGHGRVHVPARSVTRDAHQEDAVSGAAEGVVGPPVVRPYPGLADLGGVGAVGGLEAQGADARVAVVDELGGHAVTVHLGQADVPVEEPPRAAGAVDAIGVEEIGLVVAMGLADHHAAEDGGMPGVVLAELGEDVVVLTFEVVGPDLGGRHGMRIERHHRQLVHRDPPVLASAWS